jgi:hypothetical protein
MPDLTVGQPSTRYFDDFSRNVSAHDFGAAVGFSLDLS